MTTTKEEWFVMARQWPGSVPVPCRGLDNEYLRFASEEEAKAVAKKYRDGLGSWGACKPHYFAQKA